jgi:peptide/nickel transport system ATP-binding protein
MTKLLELHNVTKVFKGGTVALDDISFAIDAEAPGIVAIAGESGSGKTTLGMMVLGFLEPTEGEVLYKGKNLRTLSGREQFEFRKEVQAVFQDPFAVYNPFYKVDHILEVPIAKFKLASSKQAARDLMHEALNSVGLRPQEILGRFPHQLSGGQRQRLVVARALLLKPQLLVADEPVSMVDASLRATILESLYKLNREFGIPILYITHDLTTAYHVSDHIIILYRGSIMEAGDVDTIIRKPQHPYTQLLIDSIPWPDLQQQWGQQEIIIPDGSGSGMEALGCKFARRCPHVMDICRKSPPPLYQIDHNRIAACYLYDKAPVMAKEDVGKLFLFTDNKTAKIPGPKTESKVTGGQ